MENATAKVARAWQYLLGKEDHPFPFERPAVEWMIRVATPGTRVLEIGAGRGRMIRVLQNLGVQAQFFCMDINAYVREAPGFPFIGDARALPLPDNTFDLVYSLGVVEHFPETAHAIREHARVVRPGGFVIITTPHLGPWTPVRLFVWWRRFRHLGSFEQVLGRNLRLQEVKRMFHDAGLYIHLCVGAGTPLRGAEWMTAWISRILPEHRFGRYLICVGQKTARR